MRAIEQRDRFALEVGCVRLMLDHWTNQANGTNIPEQLERLFDNLDEKLVPRSFWWIEDSGVFVVINSIRPLLALRHSMDEQGKTRVNAVKRCRGSLGMAPLSVRFDAVDAVFPEQYDAASLLTGLILLPHNFENSVMSSACTPSENPGEKYGSLLASMKAVV